MSAQEDEEAHVANVEEQNENDTVLNDVCNDIMQNDAGDNDDHDVQQKVSNLVQAFGMQQELHLSDQEKEMAKQMLKGSGKAMYGIGAYEVYVWLAPRLVPLGWWMDPKLLNNNHQVSSPDKRKLVTQPETAYPNIDLVGALWATKDSMQRAKKPSEKAKRNHPFSDAAPTPPAPPAKGRTAARVKAAKTAKANSAGLHWRELRSVIEDPDQSCGPRLLAMRDAGLERATGIKFSVFGIRGMAVYYAKDGVDLKLLTNAANEAYLCRTAYMKGTILSVIEARRDLMEVLPSDNDGDLDLVQNDTGVTASLDSPTEVAKQLRSEFHRNKLHQHVRAWLSKTWGGGAQIPPCFSWKETVWTSVGTFCGLVLIGYLNRTFKALSDDEHFLVLGPFGALMMLQYGLTGAPAGQPRNVIWGHAIAGPIALALTYIPDDRISPIMRQILAPTIANGVMVKLGVPCPPASAHSLIYAEGRHDWEFWGLAMLSCLLSFVPAIFLNNMNPKRQYPTYWGYAPQRVYHHLVKKLKHNVTEQEDEVKHCVAEFDN